MIIKKKPFKTSPNYLIHPLRYSIHLILKVGNCKHKNCSIIKPIVCIMLGLPLLSLQFLERGHFLIASPALFANLELELNDMKKEEIKENSTGMLPNR